MTLSLPHHWLVSRVLPPTPPTTRTVHRRESAKHTQARVQRNGESRCASARAVAVGAWCWRAWRGTRTCGRGKREGEKKGGGYCRWVKGGGVKEEKVVWRGEWEHSGRGYTPAAKGRGRRRNIVRVPRCMHALVCWRPHTCGAQRETHTRQKRGREEETKEREVTLLGAFSCRLSATTRGVTPSSSLSFSVYPRCLLLSSFSVLSPRVSLTCCGAFLLIRDFRRPAPNQEISSIISLLSDVLFIGRISGVDFLSNTRSPRTSYTRWVIRETVDREEESSCTEDWIREKGDKVMEYLYRETVSER